VNDANTLGQSTRISWSTIESIEPSQTRPRLQKFIEEGKELWRAKERLLRGDVQLSEHLFARQFKRLLGTDGSDTRLASEGLLRTYLSRGELSKAVHPWLETVRLQEIGVEAPFPTLQPILDPKTMLCAHLPPFELDVAYLQNLNDYTSTTPFASAIATTLLSKEDQRKESLAHLSEEEKLIVQVLLARDGDLNAIGDTKARISTLQPWQRAWANYAIALGLLNHHPDTQRNDALIHLASVCSIESSIQPWLSGAAMLRLSEELADDGLVQQAERIQQEVIRLYPSHPLLHGD
jgi:hypothetical protein